MIYYWILSALFVHLPPLAACYSFYHSASRLVDIDAYCQADRPNSLKYGGNSRLLLRQVHIFTRHGDRTPLRGLQRETNISWAECNEREILHLTASDQVQDRDDLPPNGPSRKFERTVEIPDDDLVRRGYWSGNCNPGQLTTRGHRQLRQLGSSFRNLYLLDNSRWINNSTPTLNNHQISVRSTDVWRTIQSAQSFVSGLFQPESITPTNDFIIPLKVRPKNIDSLSVSITHCPRLMRFREESQQANIFKAFQGEMAKVNKFITEFTQSADFTLDQHYDSLQARYCHKKPLPCRPDNPEDCLDRDFLIKLANLTHWQLEYEYGRDGMSQVRAGPIFTELVQIMQSNNRSLHVYSSHDTTLLSLTASLKLFGDSSIWPPYASSLSLELLQDTSNAESKEFVRVMFNGKIMPILWCNTNEDGLCPLDMFIRQATVFGKMAEDCHTENQSERANDEL